MQHGATWPADLEDCITIEPAEITVAKASNAGRLTTFKSAVKDLAAIQHGVVKAITSDRHEQFRGQS